jgi:hypothetical protein
VRACIENHQAARPRSSSQMLLPLDVAHASLMLTARFRTVAVERPTFASTNPGADPRHMGASATSLTISGLLYAAC